MPTNSVFDPLPSAGLDPLRIKWLGKCQARGFWARFIQPSQRLNEHNGDFAPPTDTDRFQTIRRTVHPDVYHLPMVKKHRLGDIIANSVTHGIGAALALAGAVVLVVTAVGGTACQIASCSVFGCTLVLVYVCSTLYHSLVRTRARRVLRIIDHSAIYLLIAGTYTPFTLVSLRGRWAGFCSPLCGASPLWELSSRVSQSNVSPSSVNDPGEFIRWQIGLAGVRSNCDRFAAPVVLPDKASLRKPWIETTSRVAPWLTEEAALPGPGCADLRSLSNSRSF